MSLTVEGVQSLAALTRLSLSDEELELRRHEIERILAYVERLQRVDTSGIPEVESTVAEHAWRSDESWGCAAEVRENILKNFPDRVGDLLRVPAVFEQPK